MYGNVNVLKGGSNFYESAKKIYLDSSTAILKASLNATDIDKGQYYFDRTFELNLYVRVRNSERRRVAVNNVKEQQYFCSALMFMRNTNGGEMSLLGAHVEILVAVLSTTANGYREPLRHLNMFSLLFS